MTNPNTVPFERDTIEDGDYYGIGFLGYAARLAFEASDTKVMKAEQVLQVVTEEQFA